MSRQRLATLLLTLTALATGCTERVPVGPGGEGDRPGSAISCPSATDIQNQIVALYPDGKAETSALTKFNDLQTKLARGKTADAIAKMFDLVDQTIKLYYGNKLTGGQTSGVRSAMATLIGGLYCTVGLAAPSVSASSFNLDAAAAVVYPSSSDTVIATGTGWAEVLIPAGAIPGNQPVLVTIDRIPESQFTTPTDTFAGPLATGLNQYPLFYEYNTSPAVTFSVPVTVGFCLEGSIDLGSPPGSRLRVAHNIGPDQIEILPFATPPSLDCSSIQVASAGAAGPALARGPLAPLWLGLHRLGSWLLPPALYATNLGTTVPGTCCLGGSATKFSPFGGVDTLGFMTALSPTVQTDQGLAAAEPPRVRVTTDTLFGAQPIPGVEVTFQIFAGSGNFQNGLTVVLDTTDANGEAGVDSLWLSPGLNQVLATASYVAGSGFTPDSILFEATSGSTLVVDASNTVSDSLGLGGGLWGQTFVTHGDSIVRVDVSFITNTLLGPVLDTLWLYTDITQPPFASADAIVEPGEVFRTVSFVFDTPVPVNNGSTYVIGMNVPFGISWLFAYNTPYTEGEAIWYTGEPVNPPADFVFTVYRSQ